MSLTGSHLQYSGRRVVHVFLQRTSEVFHLKIMKVQHQMIARVEFHLFICVAKLQICFTFCQ